MPDAANAAAWAGFINGASGATMALVAPLWGRLSDRLGRKLMLLRATLTAAVVVGSMGFVSTPWQLLGLRLLQGTFYRYGAGGYSSGGLHRAS